MTAKFTKLCMVRLREEQGGFADSGNPFGILSWMDRHVEFEEGLTFRELLECLSPWGDAVGVMVGMDFEAWLGAASAPKPPVAEDPKERIVRVEIRPSISVDRDETTMIAEVSVQWDVFGVLDQPDEDNGHTFDVIGLDFTHPSVYADLPLVIRTNAEVSDIMTRGDNAPWNQEPAIHPTSDGKVIGFAVSPNVVDTVLYGLLGDITMIGSPERAQQKRDAIIKQIEAIKATESDQAGE